MEDNLKDSINNAEAYQKEFEDKIWQAKYQEDNKDFIKYITKKKFEEAIKEVFQEDDLDNYYKETRYSNGIHIQAKRNGVTLDLFGGMGFANQFDKEFDYAMRNEAKSMGFYLTKEQVAEAARIFTLPIT